jgi:Ricin-type beta-trefoil lectin domain/Putative Ig domain
LFRRTFIAVAVTVGLLGASAAAQAPAHAQPKAAARLPGVRVVNLHRAYEAMLGHVKPGKIAGIAYARGQQPKAPKAQRENLATCTEPACPLAYNNGPVQLTPHVYLLLWGPNWADSNQKASAQYLENFYAGLGVRQSGGPKDDWSTILSQYGDSSGNPIFSQSVYEGAFHDNSPPPANADQAAIAAEADTFASDQDISDLADAQIVVATQSGTCPAGFDDSSCTDAGTNCGWHSYSNEPYINLPYLPDAGAACGQNVVNTGTAGTNDGFSLVGGAEYADTITDPNPAGGPAPGASPSPGWVDESDTVSGGEVAGKCQWGTTWAGPTGDVTLSTGTFAMQALWSNDANACVLSDTVTVTSPKSESDTVGSSVSVPLSGSSTAGYPLTWSATGLPTGLSIDSATGLISGTPTAPATYDVTVTAADQAGTSRGASFIWTITSAGGPVNGPNGKCLDDSGGNTANGNKIDIWTCNGTGAEQWTYNGKTLSVLGDCLSDRHYTGAGTKLVLWSCIGHRNEQWTHHSNGEYVLAANGLCLTDPSSSKANGTQVEIRACENFKDQRWSLP